jgi:hypothetical protein
VFIGGYHFGQSATVRIIPHTVPAPKADFMEFYKVLRYRKKISTPHPAKNTSCLITAFNFTCSPFKMQNDKASRRLIVEFNSAPCLRLFVWRLSSQRPSYFEVFQNINEKGLGQSEPFPIKSQALAITASSAAAAVIATATATATAPPIVLTSLTATLTPFALKSLPFRSAFFTHRRLLAWSSAAPFAAAHLFVAFGHGSLARETHASFFIHPQALDPDFIAQFDDIFGLLDAEVGQFTNVH